MLNVVPEAGGDDGSPLALAGPTSSVIEGAQQILAAALRVAVAAYCAQLADERDEGGHRLVVRNERQILLKAPSPRCATAAGSPRAPAHARRESPWPTN